MEHLHLAEEVLVTVADGETLSLATKHCDLSIRPGCIGRKPWSPTWKKIGFLFSCDFFGAHIAASDLYVHDQGRVYEAAKRYFGEIMLPFRVIIAKNLDKIASYPVDMIAPSHGQIYSQPAWILEAYRDWVLHPAP